MIKLVAQFVIFGVYVENRVKVSKNCRFEKALQASNSRYIEFKSRVSYTRNFATISGEVEKNRTSTSPAVQISCHLIFLEEEPGLSMLIHIMVRRATHSYMLVYSTMIIHM